MGEVWMRDSRLRRAARLVVIVSTVVFGLVLIPAAMIAPMSVMAFDSGVSAVGALFVALVIGFPVAIAGAIPGAWVCYRRGAYRAAIGLGLLPLVNVAGVALMFAVLD
jgi:hypothetical protein